MVGRRPPVSHRTWSVRTKSRTIVAKMAMSRSCASTGWFPGHAVRLLAGHARKERHHTARCQEATGRASWRFSGSATPLRSNAPSDVDGASEVVALVVEHRSGIHADVGGNPRAGAWTTNSSEARTSRRGNRPAPRRLKKSSSWPWQARRLLAFMGDYRSERRKESTDDPESHDDRYLDVSRP